MKLTPAERKVIELMRKTKNEVANITIFMNPYPSQCCIEVVRVNDHKTWQIKI